MKNKNKNKNKNKADICLQARQHIFSAKLAPEIPVSQERQGALTHQLQTLLVTNKVAICNILRRVRRIKATRKKYTTITKPQGGDHMALNTSSK